MTILTVALIKKEAGEYDVEVIQRLRVERAGLTQLAPALDGCSSLLEMSLSGNQLTRIEGLSTLQRLQRLDLSHNKIKRIGNPLWI
jgi:Leucine-rich repeat (LRR) protein